MRYSRLGIQFAMLVGVTFMLLSCLLLYGTWREHEKQMLELLHQQSRLALSFDLAIRDYVAQEVRPFAQGVLGPNDFKPEVMSTSYVACRIFNKVRESFPDYIIKFSSNNPSNPEDRATPVECNMIGYFNRHRGIDKWTGCVNLEGKPYMAQFYARRMSKARLQCHGNPAVVPQGLLNLYGNKAGFHRPLRQVMALDTVAIPMAPYQADAKRQAIESLLGLLTGLVLVAVIMWVAFHRLVGYRLASITRHFKSAREAGESLKIPVSGKGREDEIGYMVRTFNDLADRLAQSTTSIERLNHEIEERKHAEKRACCEHDNLRAIFNAAPVGMLLVDEDFMIHDVNEAAERLLWRSSENIVGTILGCGLGCVHSFDQDTDCGHASHLSDCQIRAKINRSLENGTPLNATEIEICRVVSGREQQCWWELRTQQVLLDEHLYVVVAIHDITRRKNAELVAEDAWREAERVNEQLKLAVEQASD